MIVGQTSRPVTSGSHTWVFGLLVSRLALFAAAQSAVAIAFLAAGTPNPWLASIPWWPLSVVAVNLISIALLDRALRREGSRYRHLFRSDPRTRGRDLKWTVGLMVASIALAMAPDLGLSQLLWGDTMAGAELFVQPLPVWAAVLTLVLFPLSIGLAELPTYFGYVQPRLRSLTGSPALAVLLSAGFLALQHVSLPLIFDWQFIVWRGLMFLPFALLLGWALHRRPSLLPYLVVVHILFDLLVAVQVLAASLA